MNRKIKQFLKNPTKEYRKIPNFLKKSLEKRFSPFLFKNRRRIFEFFGSDYYSKPYPHHDVILKYLNKEKGFFVECGGNDGHHFDPTYFLEKFRKWKGIIVEPLPIYKICKKNRKKSVIYNCALSNPGMEGKKIEIINCGCLSFINDKQKDRLEWASKNKISLKSKNKKVSTIAHTLNFILDNYFSKHDLKEIDLLVIDVETYEWEVLMGINLDKYKPKFILIEIHKKNCFDRIKNLLNKNYYLLEDLGLSDYLFKIKSNS